MLEASGKVIMIADFISMIIVAATKAEIPDYVYICPVALGLVGLNMIIKGREMMKWNNFR